MGYVGALALLLLIWVLEVNAKWQAGSKVPTVTACCAVVVGLVLFVFY